ncbi:MAG TPA: hypothetical protein VHO06_12400 [Polyangia bacterium]|nr:hypothetical protein [Polyangia bacterium]
MIVRQQHPHPETWISIHPNPAPSARSGLRPATLDAAAARGHLGVVGMRERVRARGGRFRLTSAPGAGTAVEVDLDAPAAAASG